MGTILIFAGILVFPFISFEIWYKIGTKKKLKKNQDEWDEIKCNLDTNDVRKIVDAYDSYVESIWARESGSFFGCCFPRM